MSPRSRFGDLARGGASSNVDVVNIGDLGTMGSKRSLYLHAGGLRVAGCASHCCVGSNSTASGRSGYRHLPHQFGLAAIRMRLTNVPKVLEK